MIREERKEWNGTIPVKKKKKRLRREKNGKGEERIGKKTFKKRE